MSLKALVCSDCVTRLDPKVCEYHGCDRNYPSNSGFDHGDKGCVSCAKHKVCITCLLCRYCAFQHQRCKCCTKPLTVIPNASQINERLDKIERKLQKLKYSPNGYGCAQAKEHFCQVANVPPAVNGDSCCSGSKI